MKSICRLPFLVALATATLVAQLEVAAEIEADAQAVFDRYTEALGGRDAYAQIQTAKMEISMEIPAAGFMMEGVTTFKRPNKTLIDGSIAGLGPMKKGYDGETGWSVDAIQGTRELVGVELEKFVEESDLESELKLGDRYSSAKLAEKSPEGWIIVECITKIDAQPESLFFDPKTGLLQKRDYVENMGDQGKVPVTARIVSYEKIDGILVPNRIDANMMGMQSIARIKSLESNILVDDSIFEMPE